MRARRSDVDAVVVGAGPNGLAAAVVLARAGLQVRVFERSDAVGGGTRTAALTLPGFRHDVCSAVHPLALASGFFRSFELAKRVAMHVPEASYAHPFDDGSAAVAWRDIHRTADALGAGGAAWLRLLEPLANRADEVARVCLSSAPLLPRYPALAARLAAAAATLRTGMHALDARGLALLTGVAMHAIQPLPSLGAAGTSLLLGALAHARGWPIPVGGSQAIADAMASDIRAHGGVITTGVDVASIDDLPAARAVLLDVTPRHAVQLAGHRMSPGARRRLDAFRYGNAAAKVDFALSAPVPWAARDAAAAPTLHLGGGFAELAAAEAAVARGEHAERPVVLASQPSVCDPGRAPAGHHVLWAYAHVPAGSTLDPTEMVTTQLERFAPGFRDVVLASHAASAADLASQHPNYIGGDIAAGAMTPWQIVARPTLAAEPWRLPTPGVYLASASAVPGPGVHGLAGAYAARSALRREFGIHTLPHLGVS